MGKTVILGATGMLGAAFVQILGESNQNTLFSARNRALSEGSWFDFEVKGDIDASLIRLVDEFKLGPGDVVVNCIGVIKSRIIDSSTSSRESAVMVNSLFPLRLSSFAEREGFHVIQIATDCVYSGKLGGYSEDSRHDALDVYGKSKSLGEPQSDNVLNIRTSIIGPENGRSTSLVEWVRSQPKNAQIRGYVDHYWNGVTAFHFAKIVNAIITHSAFRPGTFHLVPAGSQTKRELVKAICERFGRLDLTIKDFVTGERIDRRLSTKYPEVSAEFWNLAGYRHPPTISEMLQEVPGLAAEEQIKISKTLHSDLRD